MSNAMKTFADIGKALGLTASQTVVRGGTNGSIVYEGEFDDSGLSAIHIDVEHQLQGALDAASWDGTTSGTNDKATEQGTPQDTDPTVAPSAPKQATASTTTPPHVIKLSCDQEVMIVGEAQIRVECLWSLKVLACGNDGMDLLFMNDSDKVTTWVAQMAYLLMNDFQDYLV